MKTEIQTAKMAALEINVVGKRVRIEQGMI